MAFLAWSFYQHWYFTNNIGFPRLSLLPLPFKYLKKIFLNWRWKIYFDHGMTMGRKIVVDDDREKESIWMGAICSATEQTTSSGSRQALPDISIFNHCHHHHLHLTTTVLIIITILLPRHGWQGGCAGRQVSHSSLSGGSHWTNMYFIFVIYLFWILFDF